ncbi:MAG TPA: hypothetical protein VFX21_15940, partial [Acidimicrobiia bacterium]|nr:hypothetical protein [Acidimicrobiia bacterium]
MSMKRLAALALAGLCIAATACSGDDTAGTTDVASATTTSSSPAPAADATTATTTAAAPTTAVDLCPYRGLGTWVDVYDTLPAFAERGRVSPVTPADVASMAEHGVHTLYLQ